jgi:outer membrane receptor protein involved in Fe transport
MKGYHLLLAVSSLSVATAAMAQDAAAPQADSSSMMGDIIVTAQKKSAGEKAQDVAIAITALGTNQIEALNMRSLLDLSAVAPNANLDPNGNVRGYANFAIRGVGLNASVPSIDPAVGLFIDGIYQGIPAGSITESFDLSNIQILRGPQGTLFGRNVTGGAVLVETTRPSGKFGGYIEASIETGPEYALKGAIEAPIIEGTLSTRLAGYYRNDEGWFKNNFTGRKLGKQETIIARPSFLFTSGAIKHTLILEYGHTSGEGNSPQARNAIGKFTIDVDYPGATNQTWRSATAETVIDVGFGDGSITNVFGYRKYKQFSGIDLDGSRFPLFQFNTHVNQHQLSDELRYAGRFGIIDLTLGGFYMHQRLAYRESRNPFAAGARGAGGLQISDSYGLFSQATVNLTEQLNIVGGLRYSYEKKSAIILPLTVGRCIDARVACDYRNGAQLNASRTWDGFSPKVGVNYKITPEILLYASYGKAIRSGGYNLRLTSPFDPGTYDQEDMTAYEVGVKADLFDRKLRTNLSAFTNKYVKLQRTNSTFSGPNAFTTISNSADARIQGIELEVTAQPLRGLELTLGGGYLDAKYTAVRGDLNGDGRIDAIDKGLPLTRVPKWSFSGGAFYTYEFGSGATLRSQALYTFRSRQAAQDSAVVFYPRFNDLRADVTYTLPNKTTSVSLYGRNLTDEPHNLGSISLLLTFPSTGSRQISEGRSIGIEVRQKF